MLRELLQFSPDEVVLVFLRLCSGVIQRCQAVDKLAEAGLTTASMGAKVLALLTF